MFKGIFRRGERREEGRKRKMKRGKGDMRTDYGKREGSYKMFSDLLKYF